MNRYLMETPMLDYSNAQIRQLIEKKGWKEMGEFERLKSIYLFVRDEIQFGYNVDDGVPASRVLADGYGQCNTKGTLFMALINGTVIGFFGRLLDKVLDVTPLFPKFAAHFSLDE